MIRVNLLPDPAAGRARAPQAAPAGPQGSAAVSFLTVLILIGSLGGAGYWLYWTIDQKATKRQEYESLTTQARKLEAEEQAKGKDYRALKEKEDAALRKGRVLLSLDPPDRIIWAEKLNMLAELMPEGISLSKVNLDEEVRLVPSPEYLLAKAEYDKAMAAAKKSGQRGATANIPQPKEVKIPIVKQTVTLTGIAYAETDDQRLSDINEFRARMREYYVTMPDRTTRRFMDGFNQDSMRRGDFQKINNYLGTGRDVSEFTITLTTVPMGDVPPEEILRKLQEDLQRRQRAAEAAREARRTAPAGQVPAPIDTTPAPETTE